MESDFLNNASEPARQTDLYIAEELHPGTILIVDDVESNRKVVRFLLRPEGYDFHEAEDGNVALDLLRAHTIDLVILDLMMPERDGFSVLEVMRDDEALSNIPVIIASALNESEYVERGLQLGAIDYLLKPLAEDVRKFQLALKVRNLIHMKQLRDQLSTMQEELLSQERNRTVVQMAGAASHEINQPLTVILGRLELMLRHIEDESVLKQLETIQIQAQRVSEIVKKIGQITRHETKPYVGSSSIIDIDAASASSES
jgi:CheY-like chemotaxis protein